MNSIVVGKGQVLWALQEPVSGSDNDKVVEANTQIDLYNRAAMEVSAKLNHTIFANNLFRFYLIYLQKL